MDCPRCGCGNLERVQVCWNCKAPLDGASAAPEPPRAGVAPMRAPLVGTPPEGSGVTTEPESGAKKAGLLSVPEPPAPPRANPATALPQPSYAQPQAGPPPTPYPPPPGVAPPAAPNPALPGAYPPPPAYATAAPQGVALPPPPPTYPRVQPYVPTYRPTGEVTVEHAGFWWRLAAWALDTVILNIGGFIVGFPIGILCGMAGAANGMADEEVGAMANIIALPLSLLVTFAYCTVLLAWRGQTVGMMACSLKVVNTDGTPIGFGTAVLRWVCYFIAAMPCGLGLLWMIWDPESQGWHDKLAGTYVVRTG